MTGKVSVVTGATSHLGYPMAESLAEAGSDVFIVGKNIERCKQAASRLQKNVDSKIIALKMDISSMKSVPNCFEQIGKKVGKIDVLVNAASFSSDGNLEIKKEKQWLYGIDGTINGVFRTTKIAIPLMKKNGGSIINIASMYGTVSPDPAIYGNTGYDNPPEYGAGKAAIIQFTRYIASHYAKYRIRANAISPGPFPSKSVQRNKKFIRNLEKKTPMKRIGQPYEIKGIVLFLASRASSYVTGQNVHVDGGWTSW